MRERALLVGGDVKVESRPGVGTSVGLTVPLDQADRETDEMEAQVARRSRSDEES